MCAVLACACCSRQAQLGECQLPVRSTCLEQPRFGLTLVQVSVVDAANFLKSIRLSDEQQEPDRNQGRQSNLANLLVEQVEFANVVLLNKLDLVTDHQDRGKLQAIVRQLNPGAKILEAHHCVVPVCEVLKTHR